MTIVSIDDVVGIICDEFDVGAREASMIVDDVVSAEDETLASD